MKLEGKELYLREYSSEDKDSFVELAQSEDVMSYLGGALTEAEASALFDDLLAGSGDITWSVRYQHGNEYMGHASLAETDNPNVRELSVLLIPTYWGNGHALEIGNMLLGFARQAGDIDEVVAVIDPEQDFACRICEGLGLDEGEMIEGEDGKFHFYSLSVMSDIG